MTSQIQFFTQSGQLFTLGDNPTIRVDWVRIVNGVGSANVLIPDDCFDDPFQISSMPDLMMIINEEDCDQISKPSTIWFLRRFKEIQDDDGKVTFQLIFKDSISILDRRIIPYNQSETQALLNGPSNIELKRVFDENLGIGAGVRSLSPEFRSSPVHELGPVISKKVDWKNVLLTMQQVSKTSSTKGRNLYFDLIPSFKPSGVDLIFQTYLDQRGADKRLDGPISTTNPFILVDEFEIDYDLTNFAYIGGAGYGDDKIVKTASSSLFTDALSRIEVYKPIQSSDADTLEDEAKALVTESGLITFKGQIFGNLASEYGLGDRLTLLHRDLEIEAEVNRVSGTWEGQELKKFVHITSI